MGDFVEDLPSGSDPSQISWDGKNIEGKFVRTGVYIYQVQSEGKVINGTIVVAR